eukprot:1907117-Amphidinium_carterae.1
MQQLVPKKWSICMEAHSAHLAFPVRTIATQLPLNWLQMESSIITNLLGACYTLSKNSCSRDLGIDCAVVREPLSVLVRLFVGLGVAFKTHHQLTWFSCTLGF